MTTKERIEAEIKRLGDAELDELYVVIKHFSSQSMPLRSLAAVSWSA